jgi:trans-2-enoyl-CoA reductase
MILGQRLNRFCKSNLSSRLLYSTAAALPKQTLVARYAKNGPALEVVKLQMEDLPPVPKNGVALKFLFSPINPADINIIAGNYPVKPKLPGIGGSEGLGQVVAVGEKASKFKVGDLVFPANSGFGTWRTYATAEESELFAVPPAGSVKQEYLATLSVNPATALQLLTDFVKLKEGDVVIQNGANSMVGFSVLQIAAARKIKTINIIRPRSDSEALIERMKQYGADMVISDEYLRTAEFRNLISDLPKPKLALNCVGGHSATEMARLLEKGGTMVTYGGMSLKPVTVPTSAFIFNDICLKGFWMTKWYETNGEEGKKRVLKELISLVQSEKLRLWTERHPFKQETFQEALSRATNSSVRDRKVLLSFV